MSAFPEIRRQDRLLPPERIDALLDAGEYGFLAMCAANDYGYGIPISFARAGDKIYFHCAPSGFKMQNLAGNNRVSFCVVGKTQVVPDKFTTAYESVIAFGKIATDLPEEERKTALRLLVKKYCPAHVEVGEKYMNASFHRTGVLRLDIERVTGKAKYVMPMPAA